VNDQEFIIHFLPPLLINASASRYASTARSSCATTTFRRSPHDRSVEFARKLAACGYANIANLEGSACRPVLIEPMLTGMSPLSLALEGCEEVQRMPNNKMTSRSN
jgi:hypothetical protein